MILFFEQSGNYTKNVPILSNGPPSGKEQGRGKCAAFPFCDLTSRSHREKSHEKERGSFAALFSSRPLFPSSAFPNSSAQRRDTLLAAAPPDGSRGSIPRYDAGTPLLLNNHAPTILRVEYKNDTISTKPSYISDSPTPTDTQKQFNLNQKTGARSSVQSPLQAK